MYIYSVSLFRFDFILPVASRSQLVATGRQAAVVFIDTISVQDPVEDYVAQLPGQPRASHVQAEPDHFFA